MFKVSLFSFLSILALSSASYAKCTSFYFGVHSPAKNEFAFFECKTKQVFQNSDLFFKKKNQKRFFIGESILSKPVDFVKINKVLKSVSSKSKKRDLRKIVASHGFHLTVGKNTYKIDHSNFKKISSVLAYLSTKSKPENGVLVENKKFYHLKGKVKKGPVDIFKVKITKDFYFFNGLYWSK